MTSSRTWGGCSRCRPDDALAPEVVSVPTRGVERWLAQSLSTRLGAAGPSVDGICAEHRLPVPGRLVGDALAAATGIARERDPWLVERLVWPLLDVVDAHLGEAWLSPPRRAPRRRRPRRGIRRAGRRFSSVRHIADLFDRYGVHRPSMLRAWASGDDTDGAGRPSAGGVRWQSELWRRLRERVGAPSPAERLPGACLRLREEPGGPRPSRAPRALRPDAPAGELPRRARGGRRPAATSTSSCSTPRPFSGTASDRSRRATSADAPRRRSERGHAAQSAAAHLGPGRARDAARARRASAAPTTTERSTEEPETLLGRLQADVRADRPPPGAPLGGRPDERAPAHSGRPEPRGSRLPRARAPGRGGARRDPARPGGGPDPRAARHPGHVPRRRGLRAAGACDLRRRGARRRGRRRAHARHPGAARRPLPAPDEPPPRGRRRSCSTSPPPG